MKTNGIIEKIQDDGRLSSIFHFTDICAPLLNKASFKVSTEKFFLPS